MIIYLAMICASSIMFFLSDKTSGILRKICGGIGILIPSIIAGMRSMATGTDIRVYALPMFKDAATSWSNMYSSWVVKMDQPIGYTFFAWLFGNLFSSISIFLFVSELLVVLPLYCVLRKEESKVFWGMLCYQAFLYPYSLNWMKQCIAVSMIAYAYSYCKNNDFLRFFIIVFIAYLFHQTAILFVVIFFLYKFCVPEDYREKSDLFWIKMYAATFLAFLIVFLFSSRILLFVSKLKGSYGYILAHSDSGTFLMQPLIATMFMCCIYVCTYNFNNRYELCDVNVVKDKNETLFLLYLTIVGFLWQELSMLGDGINRISIYLVVFSTLFLTHVFNKAKKNILLYIFELITIVYLFSYFVHFISSGYGEIYPYQFMD